MTKATTTCSAIKPSVSNMSNIRKSVAKIQHTRHIRRAIAAMLITYEKHPLIIVCFYDTELYLRQQVSILIVNLCQFWVNFCFGLIGMQRVALVSQNKKRCICDDRYHQVYKSPYLFRGLFKLLYEKFDKLVRESQAVSSKFQIHKSSTIDAYTGTNQILMSENPVSQCFLEIFLEGLKKVFHSYHKFKNYIFLE